MRPPNSTKLRKTKVAVDWFYDSARGQWRFLPVDLTHQVTYDRTDAAGNAMQPARTSEAKGWTHAVQAIQTIPESHDSMPEAAKSRYGHLLPNMEEVA